MKLDKLVGDRHKERPADCPVDSHALMLRGGYIKMVGNGIYSSYAIYMRIAKKIEQIIREEMNKVEGQEVQFPVAIPAALWQESGRFESVGSELVRFKDRNDSQMVLGMTHEEPAVQLVREYGNSYAKYPFMIYQIQTKFRDEPRPRAGLIRTREFVMKDGYSFHTRQEDMDEYYYRVHEAYNRIFERVGIPEVISVQSDSGMMGGKLAHEFMLLTSAGEDTVVVCGSCDYRANLEAAERVNTVSDTRAAEIEKVGTPGCKTIEEVCSYLELLIVNSCKAVMYQTKDGGYVVVFIRGDLEVNDIKLQNYLNEEVQPAVIAPGSGLTAGYTGPYKLNVNCPVRLLYDRSLEGIKNLCCGGNSEGFHYTGVNLARDVGDIEYHDFSKVTSGDICPKCGEPYLALSRGIEVGNIFQLGDKYTKALNMQYNDADGNLKHPVMGCYGIGIGRLAASVCEVRRDDNGPMWPMAIAPWQVHLCCFRSDDPVAKETADKLYKEFLDKGVEVIYDDRPVRPGVMLSDADLIGVPLRIIVSPRNIEEGVCELVSRDKSMQKKIPLSEILQEVKGLITR